MRLFDAHNHLQDERLGDPGPVMDACRGAGISRMVVNGAAEEDWPLVAKLAERFPEVLPSFGYHPWYIHERTSNWRRILEAHLDARPSAVGEIGLDRWKPHLSYDRQEEVFMTQLQIAAERNLPASIHCLKTWGRLYDLLRASPLPRCGFLLHSYGGPVEMVAPLAKLGAYFSFPGRYADERKLRQREAFKKVPTDRLLIETDAPDQLPPPERIAHPLADPAGDAINHPANLPAIYDAAAQLLSQPVEALAERVGENFSRLFGGTGVSAPDA